MSVARTRSLRRQLLAGILLPLLLIVAFNTWSLYREALGALNTAYDRTLLASAKSLGEWLDIQGEGDAARLQANVPSAALELGVEPDLAKRLFQPFRSGAGGSGFGLGLAICHEITQALGGSIQLHNRRQNVRIVGLDAIVTLPLS